MRWRERCVLLVCALLEAVLARDADFIAACRSSLAATPILGADALTPMAELLRRHRVVPAIAQVRLVLRCCSVRSTQATAPASTHSCLPRPPLTHFQFAAYRWDTRLGLVASRLLFRLACDGGRGSLRPVPPDALVGPLPPSFLLHEETRNFRGPSSLRPSPAVARAHCLWAGCRGRHPRSRVVLPAAPWRRGRGRVGGDGREGGCRRSPGPEPPAQPCVECRPPASCCCSCCNRRAAECSCSGRWGCTAGRVRALEGCSCRRCSAAAPAQ